MLLYTKDVSYGCNMLWQVFEVTSRSALIRVTPVPELVTSKLSPAHQRLTGKIMYELQLLDKGRDSKYNTVYKYARTKHISCPLLFRLSGVAIKIFVLFYML